MSSSNPYPSIGSNNHHPAKSRLHSPVGTGAIVLLMLVVLACLISYAVYRTQAWYTNNRKRLEAPPSGRWQKGHTNECWQSRCLRLIAVWCGSVEGKPKICRVGVADLPEPSQHAWDIDREVMFPFGSLMLHKQGIPVDSRDYKHEDAMQELEEFLKTRNFVLYVKFYNKNEKDRRGEIWVQRRGKFSGSAGTGDKQTSPGEEVEIDQMYV